MSHRIFWPLAISAALVGTACAADKSETKVTEVTAVAGAAVTGFSAPEEAWRTVDPENLLVIDTKYGEIGVELFPELAPKHVAQVKALAAQGFYDNVVFHRVIEGFMNQTGDGSNGDGTGDSDLPDIEAEFTFKRGTDMPFTLVTAQKSGNSEIGVGFYKSLPIASQPTSQAMFTKDGKVNAFGLHCKGVTSMARTNDPNSANSQFFLMRAKASHLDTQYSIWGNTVMGHDLLEKPKVGVIGEVPGWVPDRMTDVNLASDMPESDRPKVQVLKTDHPAFSNWVKTQRNADGTFPDICDLSVPTRTL
jgi:peptidylprolyl isomerase